ncbi:MAG: phosphotransferase [Ignavibacteriaceae bacterium]|jgi:hypothetical protein
MKKFKIIHWDDDRLLEGFMAGTIKSILIEFECEIDKSEFCVSHLDFITKIKAEKFDLIILDIENEPTKTDIGFELLNEIITLYKNSIPLLIFSRFPRVLEKIEEFRREYKLNIEFINKGQRSEPTYHQRVKEKLKSLLNLGLSDIILVPFNDFNTKSAIEILGLHNLQSIISNYLSYKPFIKKDDVNIKAIAPGYSGAFVLEMIFGSISKLLKISHDKSAILKEYENLNLYSTLLPSTIKTDYERNEPTQYSAEGWYPIIYEFVSYSSTLFMFISDYQDKQKIEGVLNNLFSNERLLKLYSQKQKCTIPINENVLEDIDSVRASYIMNSINILEPILQKYPAYFDQDIIDSITEHHSYKSISKVKIVNPNSVQILSHGDLHSDNILVDSLGFPIVIDPGSISYKHWSYDINRLLVDLFIKGFGYNTILYFDIESIENDFSISKKIIDRKKINLDTTNQSNNGFIIAINWITQNVSRLYEENFSEWEFQLGLGLEFLKASYKSISLPPNKRVLALLAACEAIRKANGTLEALK